MNLAHNQLPGTLGENSQLQPELLQELIEDFIRKDFLQPTNESTSDNESITFNDVHIETEFDRVSLEDRNGDSEHISFGDNGFPKDIAIAEFDNNIDTNKQLVVGGSEFSNDTILQTLNNNDPIVLRVTTTEDELTDNGKTSLREAIAQANLDDSKDYIIQLESGVQYNLTLNQTGFFDTPIVGDLDILSDSNITIKTVNGTAKAIINADTLQNRDRVFEVHEEAILSLDNVIVTGGQADEGGGIYVNQGTLNLTDTIVEGNRAFGLGGGIRAYGRPAFRASINIEGGAISDNFGEKFGGGVFGELTDLVVNNSEFNNNRLEAITGFVDPKGGAIALTDFSSLDVNGTDFTGNIAGAGGAIFTSRNIATEIKNGSFTLNEAVKTGGGAISYSGNEGTVGIFTNLEVINNFAAINGGGIVTSTPVEISGSLFEENTTNQDGGAIILGDDSTISDNTIFKTNFAGRNGGAVYLNRGIHTFDELEFIENEAGNDGGAIFAGENGVTLTLTNSSFLRNKAEDGADTASISTVLPTTINVSQTNFKGGIATNFGGSSYYRDRVTANYTDVTIEESNAVVAGAAYIAGAIFNGSGLVVKNNFANTGGAFFAKDSDSGLNRQGRIDLSRSAVLGNSASLFGGAFAIAPGGEFYSDNNTFAQNQSDSHGSGGYVFGSASLSSPGFFSSTNDTFSENQSNSNASPNNNTGRGAIYTESVTGGIGRSGHTELRNSIVAGNYTGNNRNNASDLAGATPEVAFNNLIGNIDDVINPNFGNTNIIGENSGLGNLTQYGNTFAYPLLDGSLAINRGNNDFVDSDTDQRGEDRIFDGIVDIGSFEVQDIPQGDLNLRGTPGNDTLAGGEGNDVFVGGRGADVFVLEVNKGRDLIRDFTDNVDKFFLPNGLSFADLRIRNNAAGTGTIIKDDIGSAIAFVKGVDADLITEDDFLVI